MVGWCERCNRKTEQVIVKNKRKETKVYCCRCNSFLRMANKADKEVLKHY